MELNVFLLAPLAFVCEYIDSTLGMGYGTTLTPILLLLGYNPLQVVPVILLSELCSGLLAAFFHHREGNVDLKPKTMNISIIAEKLRSVGYIEGFNRGVPLHLKVALLLAVCSIAGTIVAVFVAVSIPRYWLKLYIGCMIFSMGVIITVCANKEFQFSWKRITSVGLIASFNKGISGGGYGPVVTGGQILSGVEGRSAVGITSLAEGLTCAVGIIAYCLVLMDPLDLRLGSVITVGALLSVPFSAKSVRRASVRKLKLAIGIFTIILGAVTVLRTVHS